MAQGEARIKQKAVVKVAFEVSASKGLHVGPDFEHLTEWRQRTVADSYGAGDSFAAGLTYGLGAGWAIEKAVELAARCGAACLTGRGPYEGQLSL